LARGSNIIAKLNNARGPAKKNKNKDSKGSIRAASLNLYLTRGETAPPRRASSGIKAARHPSSLIILLHRIHR
jgi:hypothetical protein